MQSLPFGEIQRLFKGHGANFPIEMRRKYGDHAYAAMPFLGQIHFFYHPEHAHEIMVTQAAKFRKPRLIHRALKSSFGDGLFSSEGTLWRKQRRLIQPTFHHARISIFAERMVTHAQKMLEQWQANPNRVIDADMHALTFNIVMDALFSADASSSTDEIAHAIHNLGQGFAAQGRSSMLGLMPDWVPHPALIQKRRGSTALGQSVRKLIAERRQLGEANSPRDLLSALLFSRDETTGETMDDGQLRDELVTLYIAGHETTAVLLGWVWALLAKHPDAERKLHAELDTVLAGRAPTLEDLPRLPYTQQIIKETLRLYPPAWFLFREPLENVEICGEPLPKGCIAFVFPYANQRDERWFPQPNDFMPERWTDSFEKSLPKGAYIPFGTGPRVCIGNGFAMMEAQLILATLASRARVTLIDQPVPVNSTTTLGFAAPVRVQIQKRA